MESEKDTEKHLKKQIESLGGKCWKWVSPGVNGVMDRICFLPGSHIFFVEVKSEGKAVRSSQWRRARDLERLGQRCYMADTKATVDIIIKGELNDTPTTESPIRVYNG